jgi:FMN-dependent dehydrogenase
MRLQHCHNFQDFRKLAKLRLPSPIFNYIDGAADDETTYRRNTASFERCDLVPNVLRGVETVDMSVTVLGQKLAMPVYCSPTALQRLFHHQGERAVAAAAAKYGTMFGVSSLGTVSLEELRKAHDTPQVYQRSCTRRSTRGKLPSSCWRWRWLWPAPRRSSACFVAPAIQADTPRTSPSSSSAASTSARRRGTAVCLSELNARPVAAQGVYPGRRLKRPSHRPLISLQVDVVGHVLVNGLDDRRRRILADGIQDVSERLGLGLGTGRRALEQASG